MCTFPYLVCERTRRDFSDAKKRIYFFHIQKVTKSERCIIFTQHDRILALYSLVLFTGVMLKYNFSLLIIKKLSGQKEVDSHCLFIE